MINPFIVISGISLTLAYLLRNKNKNAITKNSDSTKNTQKEISPNEPKISQSSCDNGSGLFSQRICDQPINQEKIIAGEPDPDTDQTDDGNDNAAGSQ